MSFSLLSLPWVLGGLAALAGVLYLLQRLRVRHRPVVVPTTLFWRAAAEESPARTFRERFRHPWAYVLFLAIAGLLWLAFAGLEIRRDADDTFHVLVLDGSAGMSAGTRYSSAVAALKNRLQDLPAAQRQVIWSGGETRTLLNPGEHALLLDRRLAGLQPVAAPAGVEGLLRSLAAAPRAGRSTQVTVFGDAPVREAVVTLTKGLKVTRAPAGTSSLNNRGITALGVAESASGAWNRVDVFIRVEQREPGAAGSPAVTLDGAAVDLASAGGAAPGSFVLRDVPANGGLLAVRLSGSDDLASDDVAQIRLPDRPRLRVLLSASLNSALQPVLLADPAVQLVDADADVVVRRASESVGGGLPALEFVPSAQGSAFAITHPEELDSSDVLHHAVDAIGLREIDAMSLASAAQREIGVSIAAGPQWSFQVWEQLLSEEYNFVSSRSFPLFIANSLRWLGRVQHGHAIVAAGRPLASAHLDAGARILGSDGRVIDPLGVAYVPTQAGELRTQAGAKPLAVSLLDPATTLGNAADSERGGDAIQVSRSFGSPITWLLIGAFLLLGVEWYLLQTGRVP